MKSRGEGKLELPFFFPVRASVLGSAVIVAAMITFWGYGDTCHYEFVFDDYPGILSNVALKKFVELGLPALGELLAFSGERILSFLTFAWTWKWTGSDPCSFRIFSLLLHIMTSVLAGASGVALYGLSGGKAPARREALAMFVSTAIFAAHPVQTQAVTYIYQRITLLAAFFGLLSFLAALRWMATGRNVFRMVSIMALCTALLSKPNAAMVPVMVLVAAWCFRPEKIRGSLAWFPPLLIVPVLMRFAVGSITDRIHAHGAPGLDWDLYFLTQGRVIWKYLGIIVWPPAQSVDHVIELARHPWSAAGVAGLAGWFLIALILALAFWICANGNSSPTRKAVSFGVIWFFTMLLIESSVIPIRDLMMEHRVYLPFAGLVWMSVPAVIALAGQPWFTHRRWLPGAMAVLFVTVMSSLTEFRNRIWETPETLWRSVLVTDPTSPRAQLNLGNALLRGGRFQEALGFYDSLDRSGVLQADALYHRGLALVMLGRFEEAGEVVNRLARDFPGEDLRASYLLSWMSLVRGDFSGAYDGFSRLEPAGNGAGFFLRQVRMGKVRAAARLANAPGREPAGRSVWLERAASGLRQILAVDPADVEARVRLVRLLGTEGRIREADEVVAAAPAFIDESGAAWLSLARAEFFEDPLKPDEALDTYREALRRHPRHQGLQIWYGSFLATLGDNDRIHQYIGGAGEIDALADHAIVESQKLLGALQPDEAVNLLRRVLTLCESGAKKCSRQPVLLRNLGRTVMLADPDAKAEAESLISRGQALDPGGPGIGSGP